ncbi:NADH:ubiquinone oxidoreductase subunit NDUFA12 [Sandaracinobacter sp. RS1-74]|uniref:NADH:ubiquinone oxidoreductase subunit NDUFA12 n=1 Tax=Sandaracinobacteroides sayramensis TaxID=2913411 RepID=UPI001EDB90D6|nr:NADH:ubiquinone oxidoreductase subunit NDUFA12 [Sandaracinobacteroides sayramensis]MCG2842142.1 NADH:ubiquinone oxidoreductase subunit NDUFA12 [Sandaracinobacteroides sayramensis]
MAFNLFTWWTGSTFGTWLNTLRNGTEVGRDADGNIYYTDESSGRRWVIYATDNDSSRVPPEWHLWLHKSRADAPTQVPLPVKAWEKPWRPNPTGSDRAELPSGALAAGGRRAPAAADYRPWTPGQ